MVTETVRYFENVVQFNITLYYSHTHTVRKKLYNLIDYKYFDNTSCYVIVPRKFCRYSNSSKVIWKTEKTEIQKRQFRIIVQRSYK